jgi:hypothetical protein
VAQMLNAAGYYTEPTAQNVAVSLLAAQVDTTDVNNPALYLTEKLQGVYTDPDPRTYPLSSYSYLILPTEVSSQNSFSTAKGLTLAKFAYDSICQGQQQSALLGYSPLPINLVEAGFTQIAKIPGQDIGTPSVAGCDNPTLTANGTNALADSAPYPPACDKEGPTQCTNGTGGAAAVSTPISSGSAAASGAAAQSGAGGSGSGSTTAAGVAKAGAGGGAGSAGASSTTSVPCDPTTGSCVGSGTAGSAADPSADPMTLAVARGWSVNQFLFILIGLVVVAIVLIPGLMIRRANRRKP